MLSRLSAPAAGIVRAQIANVQSVRLYRTDQGWRSPPAVHLGTAMAFAPRVNELPPDRLAAAHDESEYFVIGDDPDEIEIVETEPGAAFADMPGERAESTPPDEGFYENLAKVLPEHVKSNIVTNLFRLIDIDKEARKKRDEQYEEGIKRTGMGGEAPGGAEFEGASRAVHPMMTEACIDYQSRVMKEVFPPSGPAKPALIGAPTTRKTEKALRVSEHMNYQITHQIRGARATMEVLFAQVPLGGSQFIRQYWDHSLSRPCWQFASVDKVLVPFAAADFASARRKTFFDTIDEVEFRRRVTNGMYLDLDLAKPTLNEEPTKTQAASRKVEGVEDPGQNVDGDRPLYETMSYIEVTDEIASALDDGEDTDDREKPGEMVPYLITIDVQSRKMLSMYRDWEAGDTAREPIEHLFEFGFIPWHGAYSIGFPQIIGGLSAAATGALRGLLDSAHVNNIPSAIALKGSGSGGQTKTPNPGEIVELDSGTEADDVRKRVMPMPFNPPSNVLFQLLGFLVDSARGIVRTTLDETAQNAGTPVPVGTQMSRVEEGLVVFSAIHGRAHAGMDRLLRGLHRLNRLYLPEEVKVDARGLEIMVRREDYEGPCDVGPASDPTIYSDLQRFNQLGYIQQRLMVTPNLWKVREVELAGLKLIKWPDPESLLHNIPEPREMNAVNENLAMCLGQPVEVYPGQDHLAHLQVHLDFVKSPVLGGSQLFAPIFLQPAIKHSLAHIAHYYASHTARRVSEAAGVSHLELGGDDPRVKESFDRVLAMASRAVMPELDQALAGVLPVLMNAMQLLHQVTPPGPVDPAQAAIQVAQGETQRKTADDSASHQLDQQKLQTDAATQQSKNQIAIQRNAIEADRVAAMREGQQVAAQTKIQTTEMDTDTARDISADRLASGGGTQFRNGESLKGA
jgi:hypothetical protein